MKFRFFCLFVFMAFTTLAFADFEVKKSSKSKKKEAKEQKRQAALEAAITYKYQLTACLMFQNEEKHLKEWIEYHKLIGVEHFYLFNNLSTDNYLEILEPYLRSGEVELFDYPYSSNSQAEYLGIQCNIYNHALTLASKEAKWLAIIDTDEFIVPLKTNSLLEALKEFEKYGGVYLNWVVFGTSHVDKIPRDRLQIEMLNHTASATCPLGKSIVRPNRVKTLCTDPHRMWYIPPFYHVNANHETFDWISPIADDKLIIHHYYTGDLDFLVNVKFPRVKKWIGIELLSYIESLEGLNELENNTMQRFIPQLKTRMNLPQ